jgi:drug/metabolite transporter (DMT)-like permease
VQGAAYLLSFKLIADLGPTRALTVTFLVPAFGVLWGILLLGERISLGLLVGGLLVVLGTALANGAVRWPRLR